MYFFFCFKAYENTLYVPQIFCLRILCSDTPKALSIKRKLPIIICACPWTGNPYWCFLEEMIVWIVSVIDDPVKSFLVMKYCRKYKEIIFDSQDHVVRFLILAVWSIKQQLACIWNTAAILQISLLYYSAFCYALIATQPDMQL